MEQGRLDEALELAIRAKEGYESVFGVDHEESQDARDLVADIEVMSGLCADFKGMLQDSDSEEENEDNDDGIVLADGEAEP